MVKILSEYVVSCNLKYYIKNYSALKKILRYPCVGVSTQTCSKLNFLIIVTGFPNISAATILGLLLTLVNPNMKK